MVDDAGALWTAVVLAGGRGSRMGGRDKPDLTMQGRSLLAHVLDGLPGTVPAIVVGPARSTERPVTFVREEPAFGGPVAAVAAAVPLAETAVVGLVGADMPRVGPLITRLVDEWAGEEALVAVDASGRRQPLCAVLDTRALADALVRLGPPAGRSLRDLFQLLDVHERALAPEESGLLLDVDVPEDLNHLR